jgi:anti-sigma regulatory factor (Ser/Thr protein kinase)
VPEPASRRLVLLAETSAVPLARHWASEVCAGQGLSSDALGVLQLLVTEAVANAVEHGAGPVTLEIGPLGQGVHVTVHDASPDRPVLRHVGAMATGGRGVALIDGLASDWGVVTGADLGKTVWFDVGPDSGPPAT